MTKPTILFIHGAWHSSRAFQGLIEKVRHEGYGTTTVELPSVGTTPPLKDWSPDVDTIRHAIDDLLAKGVEIILFAHSYGGGVMSEALKGLAGNPLIKHVIYCCAFILPVGSSLAEFAGGDPAWWVISSDRLTMLPNKPEELFYNDLPEEEAKEWAAHIRPHAYHTSYSKATYAAWEEFPCSYFYCVKDNAIPLDIQKIMAEQIAGGRLRTETFDTSHSPFLSKPDLVVDAIKRTTAT